MVEVVRHPETEWNRDGIVQGHLDSSLTAEGIATANRVGKKLQGKEYKHFYTSDLGRCMQTAEILSAYLSTKPVATNRLRERDFGRLNGVKRSVADTALDKNSWTETAPEGESLRQVFARVESLLKNLPAHESPVLCVTHEGALRTLLAMSQETELQSPSCDSSPESVYVFTYIDDNLKHKSTF